MIRTLVASVLICTPMSTVLAQEKSEPGAYAKASKFTGQVVQIIPKHAGGSSTVEGLGLIVGEQDDKLYIAIPRHLLLGSDYSSQPTSQVGVVFSDLPRTMFKAQRLGIDSKWDDLAAVSVDHQRGRPRPSAPMVSVSHLPLGTLVWNIGIPQKWKVSTHAGGLGPLDVVSGRVRVDSLPTPSGASGAAGVTELGVIGMVLEGNNEGSNLLPIERIVEVFKAWTLPVNLLTPVPASAYPSLPFTVIPSPSKPNGYCDELKRIIKSASNDFADILVGTYDPFGTRSKAGLSGWGRCRIGAATPDKKQVFCDLGPFVSIAAAEEMAEKVTGDINTCLSPNWSMSRDRDRVNRTEQVEFEPNDDGPTIRLSTYGRSSLAGPQLNIYITP